MTYTVELSSCFKMMKHIAKELKDRHNVGDNEIIWPWITKEHGIKIKYGNLISEPIVPATVTFPSESYYTFLVLKYS